MLALILPFILAGFVFYAVRKDSRKKGIGFLAYLGVIVAVVAVGAGGAVLSTNLMNWVPGTGGVVCFMIGVIATAAACIGLAVMAFKRLLAKQRDEECRRSR